MNCALGAVSEFLEIDTCCPGCITRGMRVECESYIEEFWKDNEIARIDWSGFDKFINPLVVCGFIFPSDIELDEMSVHVCRF